MRSLVEDVDAVTETGRLTCGIRDALACWGCRRWWERQRGSAIPAPRWSPSNTNNAYHIKLK